jgi:hypothetical protein
MPSKPINSSITTLDYTNSTSKSILNKFENGVAFVTLRLPNANEVFANTISKSIADTLLGRYVNVFGDNPGASSIVRDVIKIPGALITAYYELEIGHTGDIHDAGSLYALGSRLLCKGSILGATYAMGSNLELAGRYSNYPCDSFSRFFYIVSRERQAIIRENPEYNLTYHEFLTQNSKFSWVVEATGEATLKTFVGDMISQTFINKESSYPTLIREAINKFETSALGNQIIIENKADIYTKIGNYINLLPQENVFAFCAKLIPASIFIIIADFVGKLATETIGAYILMPISRIVQDLTGKTIREMTNYAFSDEVLESEIIGAIRTIIEDDKEL